MEYKVYCLDQAGRIASAAEHVEASSDDEAIVLVRSRIPHFNCEIWKGNRLVSRVHAQQAEERAFDSACIMSLGDPYGAAGFERP